MYVCIVCIGIHNGIMNHNSSSHLGMKQIKYGCPCCTLGPTVFTLKTHFMYIFYIIALATVMIILLLHCHLTT